MIPKKVTIQGHETAIIITDKMPDEIHTKDTLGLADVLDHKIFIHKDLSPHAKEYILRHEIFHHALWNIS